jgi:hypothetical protein
MVNIAFNGDIKLGFFREEIFLRHFFPIEF